MKITKLKIENFRSIKSVELNLDDVTVFIGPNNSGKSAILEAIRIGLSRRWGQRGTGFTENDVHLSNEDSDPRTAPAVKVQFEFEEPSTGSWPSDLVATLEDIMVLSATGVNKVSFSITYTWDPVKESFEPAWEFLNSTGTPLPPRKRSINLSGFYDYVLLLWLGALRDVDDEFASRSKTWGRLLRSIKISPELEKTIKETLDNLDADLLAADPKLAEIAETIGRATEIAIEDNPGGAKLRMLPMNVWDLLARAGVVLRNENQRPWLPLGHHGQGLQSLSVIFLLQAAASQQLSDELQEGTEPIFAIEEPEVHLHPQAARTLWMRISEMPGQKIVTTHSPYFVQNVPLHNLRIARFKNGTTEVTSLPKAIVSTLPWTSEVENYVSGRRITAFRRNVESSSIEAIESFNEVIENELGDCYRSLSNATEMRQKVASLRHLTRCLISTEDEEELSFLCRRIRGEIFFARYWIMVEGVCEYLLLKALGHVKGYDLDQHGIAIIDFQNNGNASIYPALAVGFGIPWFMITDGDAESEKFKKQLLKRGFSEDDLNLHLKTLSPSNDLENQLLADGHEALLRGILNDIGDSNALNCSLVDLKRKLKNKKTSYINRLAPLISRDLTLANRMPTQFVELIETLKGTKVHG